MQTAWIFHIIPADDWLTAQRRGFYEPPSLRQEGFIHCSRCEQILPVAQTFYAGRDDLFLLRIHPGRLESELRWEPPAGGVPQGGSADDLFPHLYGVLNLDAVDAVFALERSAEGVFRLPEGVC